ncbi:hypothetical protein D3C76_1320690 [compost metagenome]
MSRGAKSANWKRSGAEYSLSGNGSTRLSETRRSSGRRKWLPEKAIMFFCWSMVKSFISFGKFHSRITSGFHARIFSFMLRNTSESDWPESVLRPSPIKLSPPRISSTVAPLSIVLRLVAMTSC